MYCIDGMQNELMRLGYKWKGTSKKVRLKEEEVLQIISFLMRKVHGTLHVKMITCLGHAGVAVADPLKHKRASAKGVLWLLG